MNDTFVFELSTSPIMRKDRVKSHELPCFFFQGNPYMALGKKPCKVSDRVYALDCLKKKLPQGYTLDLVNETIDILNPDDYLQETFKHLQNINTQYNIALHLWWRQKVCLFDDILIYFEEELFTLHEFLLYMISKSKEDGIQKLYVGGVFEYYD